MKKKVAEISTVNTILYKMSSGMFILKENQQRYLQKHFLALKLNI